MAQTGNRKEFESVQNALKKAEEYGMQTEVVTDALKAMKENPKLTISQAIEAGCREWDV